MSPLRQELEVHLDTYAAETFCLIKERVAIAMLVETEMTYRQEVAAVRSLEEMKQTAPLPNSSTENMLNDASTIGLLQKVSLIVILIQPKQIV